MVLSSSSVKTLPLGFEGLQMMMAFAPPRNASSSAFGSKENVGGFRGTKTGSQSAMMTCAR